MSRLMVIDKGVCMLCILVGWFVIVDAVGTGSLHGNFAVLLGTLSWVGSPSNQNTTKLSSYKEF